MCSQLLAESFSWAISLRRWFLKNEFVSGASTDNSKVWNLMRKHTSAPAASLHPSLLPAAYTCDPFPAAQLRNHFSRQLFLFHGYHLIFCKWLVRWRTDDSTPPAHAQSCFASASPHEAPDHTMTIQLRSDTAAVGESVYYRLLEKILAIR